MLKEIKYNGYTAQPSDYENPDGDLALSVGMVPENGSLHPVMPPKVLTTWKNVNRVFVHKNNYTHYIVVQNGDDSQLTLKWCDDKFGDLSDSFLTLTSETITDITAIGNMLIVASSVQMYYVLWKDGTYKFLANSIPDVNIGFALQGEVKSHVYTDKNIEASTSSVTTTDEGWSTLATFAYYFRSVPAGGYSDYTYLSESITLNANTNYAFSTQYSTATATHYFCLEGISSSTGAYEQIIQGAPRATSKHYTMTPKVTYTKLRLRVKNRSNDSAVLSNTLVIEQGATTSASVTLDNTVKNTSDNYTAMLSICNSFVNKYATNKGKFIYPFFIRYAIKLHDGSYARISSPVLMVPNSGYAPLLHFVPRPEATDNVNVTAYAFLCDLQMRLFSSIGSEWEDIIQGVDIFVSQPVYPYAQGKAYDASDNTLFTYKVFDSTNNVDELSGIDYGNLRFMYNGSATDSGVYQHIDICEVLKKYYSFCDTSQATQWRCIEVAPYTAEHIREDIQQKSTFYLVHSLNFDDLLTPDSDFVDINLKDGVLENLIDRKALSDELMSDRTLMTGNLYAYNNRLHVFNASFRLPTPKCMLLNNQYITPSGKDCTYIYVYLHTTQGTKVVSGQADANLVNSFGLYGLTWFYYPDNNAYRALLVSSDKKTYLDLKLTRHELLNGAYWFADSLNSRLDESTATDGVTVSDVDDEVSSQSSVYVSEVNNTFTFLSVMAVSIGCNNVYALATCAKPLSTGQFGQFPLYAFTDNGVWAMEIKSSGAYIARQPITLDVLTNPDSICQMESSVLFATDRGVMELAGLSANCITDKIRTEHPFDITSLPEFSNLLTLSNGGIDTANEKALTTDNIKALPFASFLKKCRILNDYINQRVILFNPDVRYAYVFSRDSSAWGMAQSDNVMKVNSYPQAQAIDGDGNLLDYSQTDATYVSALLVTRPFAMGEPDYHKTLTALIQRGFFRKKRFSVVVYGSNDLFNWLYVSSSFDEYMRGMSGTPFKYYRIAVFGKVQPDESLYGFSARYDRKLLDQPR